MKLNFGLFEYELNIKKETYWAAMLVAVSAGAQMIVQTDLTAVTDWETWVKGLFVGMVRPAFAVLFGNALPKGGN